MCAQRRQQAYRLVLRITVQNERVWGGGRCGCSMKESSLAAARERAGDLTLRNVLWKHMQSSMPPHTRAT